MTSEPPPEESGSIRFDADGKVEYFDGREWKRYGAANDAEERSDFREHDLPEST